MAPRNLDPKDFHFRNIALVPVQRNEYREKNIEGVEMVFLTVVQASNAKGPQVLVVVSKMGRQVEI